MRIALIGLAALLPALASAEDPKPYVVYQGRAVRSGGAAPVQAAQPTAAQAGAPQTAGAPAVRPGFTFGSGFVHTSITGGRSSFGRPAPAASRAFRGSSFRRGFTSSRRATAGDSAPPAYAVPGAKILTAGQQPVYSPAAGGGTHSIEGGGFIAMDQAKAHDVGRAPGISWAPPDTPPGRNPQTGGGGTGASANGPAPAGTSGSGGSTSAGGTDSGGHISGTGNGGNNNNGSNGNGNNGNGNNGGDNNNFIGGGLSF